MNFIEGNKGIATSSERMMQCDFKAFEAHDEYLISQPRHHNNYSMAPQVGQYRVSFSYDKCGPATIMAQQI